jgi:hypothetical protein
LSSTLSTLAGQALAKGLVGLGNSRIRCQPAHDDPLKIDVWNLLGVKLQRLGKRGQIDSKLLVKADDLVAACYLAT